MLAACRQGLRLKLLRMLVAAATVGLYVQARSWLAGDQVRTSLLSRPACPLLADQFVRPFYSLQLIHVYRKLENPIPFAPLSLSRKLTTGYVHARYAWLLIAPLQLSGASGV